MPSKRQGLRLSNYLSGLMKRGSKLIYSLPKVPAQPSDYRLSVAGRLLGPSLSASARRSRQTAPRCRWRHRRQGRGLWCAAERWDLALAPQTFQIGWRGAQLGLLGPFSFPSLFRGGSERGHASSERGGMESERPIRGTMFPPKVPALLSEGNCCPAAERPR